VPRGTVASVGATPRGHAARPPAGGTKEARGAASSGGSTSARATPGGSAAGGKPPLPSSMIAGRVYNIGDDSGPRPMDMRTVAQGAPNQKQVEKNLAAFLKARGSWLYYGLASGINRGTGERPFTNLCALTAMHLGISPESRSSMLRGTAEEVTEVISAAVKKLEEIQRADPSSFDACCAYISEQTGGALDFITLMNERALDGGNGNDIAELTLLHYLILDPNVVTVTTHILTTKENGDLTEAANINMPSPVEPQNVGGGAVPPTELTVTLVRPMGVPHYSVVVAPRPTSLRPGARPYRRADDAVAALSKLFADAKEAVPVAVDKTFVTCNTGNVSGSSAGGTPDVDVSGVSLLSSSGSSFTDSTGDLSADTLDSNFVPIEDSELDDLRGVGGTSGTTPVFCACCGGGYTSGSNPPCDPACKHPMPSSDEAPCKLCASEAPRGGGAALAPPPMTVGTLAQLRRKSSCGGAGGAAAQQAPLHSMSRVEKPETTGVADGEKRGKAAPPPLPPPPPPPAIATRQSRAIGASAPPPVAARRGKVAFSATGTAKLARGGATPRASLSGMGAAPPVRRSSRSAPSSAPLASTVGDGVAHATGTAAPRHETSAAARTASKGHRDARGAAKTRETSPSL